MTAQTPVQANQESAVKTNDKELNFRMLESKYEKQLAQERTARLEAEKEVQRLAQSKETKEEESDDDSEPYVDNKRLARTLSKFGKQAKQETQGEIQKAVQTALQEERKQNWLKSNPDFYDVIQQHAEKFAQEAPDLAESILEMPEGFERQKLVYKNIKTLGFHKPEVKQPSIQDKVDSNRRSPFYQPSGVGSSPYNSQADFSEAGQKQAYAKMQELKNRLRIG